MQAPVWAPRRGVASVFALALWCCFAGLRTPGTQRHPPGTVRRSQVMIFSPNKWGGFGWVVLFRFVSFLLPEVVLLAYNLKFPGDQKTDS